MSTINDKIIVSDFTSPLNEVNKCRTRFGLGNASNPVSQQKTTLTVDYNNLIQWLQEAKNKAGAPTSIPSKINAGTIMYANSLNDVNTSAINLYNWCKCHGNCSGSCTGSCTGSCSGGCDSCRGCDWTSSDSGS